MTGLDLASLAEVVAGGPRPLFATVSGAHLYGFASPDSDVDLRGAFVLPMPDVLGLREPKDTLTVSRLQEGVEIDWVAHDVRKFADLMTRRNGYVLEQLYSPLVVAGGERLEELRGLGRGCVTRPLYYHYRGFLSTKRKALAKPEATVKDLLYAYRVVLTGVHVLRTGVVESHLATLAEEWDEPGLDELMARKVEGAEKGRLEPGEAERHGGRLDALEQAMARAFEESKLPMRPTTYDELSDFVVRVRLEG